jgi:hypothetical protein
MHFYTSPGKICADLRRTKRRRSRRRRRRRRRRRTWRRETGRGSIRRRHKSR